jgi:hypothetical protein
MPRIFDAQTNFSGGLIDELMLGRVDTEVYENGCEVLDNWSILSQGAVRMRGGLEWLVTLDNYVRLAAFVFSDTQAYVVAFDATRLRVYATDGTLLQTITGAPWSSESIVNELTWSQRGDVMIICHATIPMQKLIRTSASTFSMNEFDFSVATNGDTYQPYLKVAEPEVTLTPSATTGSITLTTSASHWVSDHVGSVVRYEGEEVLITGFTSDTVVDGTVGSSALSGTAASVTWDEQVFSDANGYPGAVVFHGQRLWFAGSTKFPAHVFSSKASEFFNFDTDDATDDDSIQGPALSDRVNTIRHLVSSGTLYAITDQASIYFPETDEAPTTPTNFNPRLISRHGATQRMRPTLLEDSVFYAQSKGRSIRRIFRDAFTNRVKNESVSLAIGNKLAAPLEVETLDSVANRPESYSFFVMDDGNVAAYMAVESEQVQNWSRWTTQGDFKSVTAVNEDLFFVVKRVVGGSDSWTLEKLNPSFTLDYARSGTPGSTFVEYANQTVDIVGDGEAGTENVHYLGSFSVDGTGAILNFPY